MRTAVAGSLESGGSAFKNSCQTWPLFTQPVINLHDKCARISLSVFYQKRLQPEATYSASSGANPLAIHRTVFKITLADCKLKFTIGGLWNFLLEPSASKSDNYWGRFLMKKSLISIRRFHGFKSTELSFWKPMPQFGYHQNLVTIQLRRVNIENWPLDILFGH